ncbi:unnamed protein product [Soboliphyme baturini]|uniref:Uncharacterized protein n=1 Tax=Soboliphyme baturini TaxID=241478 RepID=A0A183IB72_9BILA|nr:unnamed protein product [Soboliphyme baturini]
MGNPISKEVDEDPCNVKQRKLLREAADLKMKREIALENVMCEDELARKIASSRYLFWYTGLTIPPITIIALKE